MRFGIRHEEKEGERRTPLSPDQVAAAIGGTGAAFTVQPSSVRVFGNGEYRTAGAELSEDISAADLVMGIKEIPAEELLPDRAYLYFSHVIKGQPHNMGMLRTLMKRGCTLLDYEKIEDEQGRRLIFFGNYAGLAGMYEALHAMGRRFASLGVDTPFQNLRRPLDHPDLEACAAELEQVGERIAAEGLPPELTPLVIGFAGYGNVSKGAQSVIDEHLPVIEIEPEELESLAARSDLSARHVYKVVFKEWHMVEPAEGRVFELQEYYQHPERYRGVFERHLPALDVLVNCIYWTERYPRLVTLDWCRRQFAAGGSTRLKVIADISCDVGGSIECNVGATHLPHPVYTFDPVTGDHPFGHEGRGLTVLAVDNLPAALPRESSTFFGQVLSGFLLALAEARWDGEVEDSGLPPELRRAIIVWRGRLTPDFEYLKDHLSAGEAE